MIKVYITAKVTLLLGGPKKRTKFMAP